MFPLRTSERPLFESIMPVVVAFITVLSANLYFKKVESGLLREGFLLGAIWFAISVLLDLLMFMQGPMAMTIVDYLKDIGLTYLIIPTITISFGFLAEEAKMNKSKEN
jgi:hypothetical protein